MSHTAHIPSHRKPRQRASKSALRAGVAGGVLSTIAVAGAAGPAQAEPVTQTIEMPTITSGFSTAVAASAQATQQVALDLETQADEDAAAEKAAKTAKKAHAEAVRKAEAKKKAEAAAKAEAEAKERAERASRTAERTTLSASSGSSDSTGSSASAPSSSSNVSGSAASIVAFAKAQVGDAYVSGGTGPNAWDCSGLVQAAYRTAGIDLPRVSQSQSTAGTQVSLDNLQPGDILYWGGAGSAYHVAIYVGGGEFVGAQNSSTGTVQRSLDYDRPTGAVRVL
ncbi:C40 family peptidase [Streptomyces sp. ID03-2B]|uniref:C40 family peptidase n=1 Tax=Streptomyces caviscabies TaxID=90079 RepID=A0ABW2MFM6_9ACTN|nr:MULTISPECIES: C40 family peptidase [Streptomyces]MCL6291609.1 C40 family peptidase [Streptomyces sp. 43Y-GA-1]MCX4710901.1 C40 family peptidase [Streptomyces griseus]MDX2674357.1 C40 family peptidase [Streptomyces sp. NRRL_ISP-5395]MDX3336500.1 C40 family peptidase [Streptomyces sp. ME02-6979.5a]MDX3504990.1 C40 family peptidase [Streptomyces sp. ATCC51928]